MERPRYLYFHEPERAEKQPYGYVGNGINKVESTGHKNLKV